MGLPLSGESFYQKQKKGEGLGISIAGLATNIVALVVVILWLVVIGAAVAESNS